MQNYLIYETGEIMKKANDSKSGQIITRSATCSQFDARKSLLAIETICWFCKYADFDLKDDKLPEKGICKYPEIQKD